jgi:hypothetical protein
VANDQRALDERRFRKALAGLIALSGLFLVLL